MGVERQQEMTDAEIERLRKLSEQAEELAKQVAVADQAYRTQPRREFESHLTQRQKFSLYWHAPIYSSWRRGIAVVLVVLLFYGAFVLFAAD